MMKKPFLLLIPLLCLFGSIGISNATLWDRGDGLIYDDVLEITWLQDANLADTEDFDVPGIAPNGKMTWNTANLWIAAMNSDNYLGFSDWRLPDAHNADGTGPQSGFVNSSEMGHMYYSNLGGARGGPMPSPTFIDGHGDEVSFDHLMSYYYWSGTADGFNAWDFAFFYGRQELVSKAFTYYAWAVRTGDVSTLAPAPGTMWLLGSGLALLCVFRGRIRRRQVGDRVIHVIRSLMPGEMGEK